MRLSLKASVVVIVLLSGLTMVFAAEEQPIDVIEDNSFLVEEAYNQEAGVVQHIFNAVYTKDARRHGWQFSFTQEWPVYGLDHQLSYTIPSFHLVDDGDHQNGIGDVLLNYRYQALEEGPGKPAFAPRFSLILPTGSRNRGTGNGVVGYQWSLPFSKKVASRLALQRFGLRLFVFGGIRRRPDRRAPCRRRLWTAPPPAAVAVDRRGHRGRVGGADLSDRLTERPRASR